MLCRSLLVFSSSKPWRKGWRSHERCRVVGLWLKCVLFNHAFVSRVLASLKEKSCLLSVMFSFNIRRFKMRTSTTHSGVLCHYHCKVQGYCVRTLSYSEYTATKIERVFRAALVIVSAKCSFMIASSTIGLFWYSMQHNPTTHRKSVLIYEAEVYCT